MALLVSTGVVTLLCQACTNHSSVSNASSYATAAPAVSELSEGQRLSTDLSFASQVDLLANGAAVHARTSSLLSREPAVAVDATTLTSGDIDIIEAFAITTPRTMAEKSLTGLTWSGAESVRAFEGSRNLASYLRPLQADQNFSAEIAFAAPAESTGLGFDLSVSPRVAYNKEGQFATRRVGAEVRVGQNFDQRGERIEVDSWYIFAGQDGEALVWEAGDHGFSNITGAMALRDQVTVGDVQAGISVQRGLGELSLSYIRREVEYRDRNGGASTNEDFAGISFTMRR